MKIHSLTRQTIAIVVAAQLLFALTFAGIAVLHEGHTRLRAFDVSLQGRSDSLLGAIQDAEDVNSMVEIDPAELKIPAKDVFAVYNRGGSMLGSSADASPLLIAREHDGFRTVLVNGARYRVLQREGLRVIDRAESGGAGLKRPVTILYSSPETHVWHEIFEAVSYYLLAIATVATVTTVSVGIFLRRALRPLSELAVAASQVAVPSLEFNPPASALHVRELRPLAEVLAESVSRLRESFEKEQRFLGDAAHELKTALAVVRSSAQVLMLKQRSPQEYALGLARVLEDNVRAESLVTKMLQLASVAESRDSATETLDLSDEASKVADELHLLSVERGIEIHCSCVSGAKVLLAPERARALISNLLLNAIQHSRPGTAVSVCVQRNGEKVLLTVSDCGAGIGDESLPYIFDRFYREDRSRSRDTGGAGLGLSICKAIVESAGGTIQVASKRAAGTTMTVIFSAA